MSRHKIIKIETIIPESVMGNLVLLRIHTEDGLIGHGESYYCSHAVASLIHDWMSRRLLGNSALDINAHWRFLYERSLNFGGRGAELRALSAIDLALWDITAQSCEVPLWQLLGGKSRESIPVYNSSGGKTYGVDFGSDKQGWPGYGGKGKVGEYEDYWEIINHPESYAQSLINEGYTGLKTWLFDEEAHKDGGSLYIHPSKIEKCLQPIKRIRDKVGDQIEIMVDGHGFFELPTAIRISNALEKYNILWAEDLIRPDNLLTLKQLKDSTNIPFAVSEMFNTREQFQKTLDLGLADYIEIDPTWVGGVSESMNIARMAQGYNIPVTFHDCTGPLTVMSGLQMSIALTNVVYQETVRAHFKCVYDKLIDEIPKIDKGRLKAPTRSGLGCALLPSLFSGHEHQYRCSKL